MALSVTHAFVSAIADDPGAIAAGEVVPQTHWNAAHTLTGQASVAQGGTGLASGTSGGIPYFNTTTSMLSSALLAANLFVVGGGAGAAPATITNAAATAQLNLFTSGLQGLVPASGGGTTNFLRADGSFAAPPGGAPGSPSLSVQFNNAGAFAGMSGTSWDDTNRSLTMTGATVTTSHPVFDMTQTWNAGAVTFSGWRFNVTATANAAASKVIDIQVNSASIFAITIGNGGGGGNTQLTVSDALTGTSTLTFGNTATFSNNLACVNTFSWGNGWGSLSGGNGSDVNITSAGSVGILMTPGSNHISLIKTSTAQALRVYNTADTNADAPTNWERIALDFTTTSNVATLGPQKGGTGTLRYMQQTVAFASQPPTTKTANYSQTVADEWLIFNGAGSLTLTLLSAASFPGLELYVLTIAAQTVVSASSNVIPRAGGAAGTAILAGAAGNWALLVSNGTNWQIMAGTP